MRIKTLLFVLLTSVGMAQAQDTIRSLVITEACLRGSNYAYLELTNMGDEDLQLADFSVGKIEPWGPPPFEPRASDRIFRLPERVLVPGESFLIANVYDYVLELHAKGIEKTGGGFQNLGSAEVMHKKELEEMADLQIHQREDAGEFGQAYDSISSYASIMGIENGRDCWFVQYHLSNGDSVAVDQVGGVFDAPGGLNHKFGSDAWSGPWGYDVAGVAGATYEAYLIRRFVVKQGNLDFANARGVGLDDSEWIAIPVQGGSWRKALWTVGNHVNAQLDENTLESDVIEVDFANKTLTVPWGVRRNDDIMNYFVKKTGIGWNYHRAAGISVDDSLSFAAKTGDQLELFVCGDVLDRTFFEIIVEEPTADARVAIPKMNQDPEGNWRNDLEAGMLTWPRVTRHESGIDTIWGEWGGIPYQTRIDTLMDRLEIPSNATWQLVTVDGVERPDLKEGDVLKIIAQDGSEKEYYISVNDSSPSDNAKLSAITWPDIPDFYRGIFGWKGDTIPNFNANTQNYTVSVPFDVNGIPALVPKTQNVNAKVKVERATSLSGSMKERTVTFTVTAENDSTKEYTVELRKEINPNKIQPFYPDPIISEYLLSVQWANNYMEIFNPGNQPLDLSNYIIISSRYENPAAGLSQNASDFKFRYRSYVPGYKFTNNEAIWAANPGILEFDLTVNTIVEPGGVFVMAAITNEGRNHVDEDIIDIEFQDNPWGAEIDGAHENVMRYSGGYYWLCKILNDSIKQGLKAPNDINDFEVIDTYDLGIPTEVPKHNSFRRKVGIWQGNPVLGASQEEENSEWDEYTRDDLGGSWPAMVGNVGQHFFIPPTNYLSTVSSAVYKVSEGYSLEESIRGVTTGTTVADFMANIIKKNEEQVLNVHSVADGSVLGMDAALSMNDTLEVMSADSVSITKYILEVTEEGLSSNAVLTSLLYDIDIDQQPAAVSETKNITDNHSTATITGFEYGTPLNTLLTNIEVPFGANLSIIDGEGAYVPLKRLNFDTTYVFVTASANTYFDVLAEDGITRITYQLQPESTESDAFVLSDVYSVRQRDRLIEYVPRGTNVASFLSNLIPSLGATMKVVDKMGNERVDGTVADDDKLVVTSEDGTAQTVYYIAKLATEYVQAANYLAYIFSDVYVIDQINYLIYNASGTDISEFYSRIEAAAGATAVVVDSEGNEKTTGDLDGADKVKVTSADGNIEVVYTFGPLTSNQSVSRQDVVVYPNPTTGMISIAGGKTGSKVQVFNPMGAMIRTFDVQKSIETISIENQPSGIYLIVVSDKGSIENRFKVVKF